jgi:hypothetical protein
LISLFMIGCAVLFDLVSKIRTPWTRIDIWLFSRAVAIPVKTFLMANLFVFDNATPFWRLTSTICSDVRRRLLSMDTAYDRSIVTTAGESHSEKTL